MANVIRRNSWRCSYSLSVKNKQASKKECFARKKPLGDGYTGEGKERRDDKLTGGEIRRRGGRAAEAPLPGEDGAPAAACSLASVPMREGA